MEIAYLEDNPNRPMGGEVAPIIGTRMYVRLSMFEGAPVGRCTLIYSAYCAAIPAEQNKHKSCDRLRK